MQGFCRASHIRNYTVFNYVIITAFRKPDLFTLQKYSHIIVTKQIRQGHYIGFLEHANHSPAYILRMLRMYDNLKLKLKAV